MSDTSRRRYHNPVFVEGMVRNVAMYLQAYSRVSWLRVDAVNPESIHNHGAFASCTWTRRAATITDAASIE